LDELSQMNKKKSEEDLDGNPVFKILSINWILFSNIYLSLKD
jgi:hypothetical protein